MGEHRDLGFATHWGDEVDYMYECLLEITAANVAALLKSEFTWDDAALEAARGYVRPPEALDCIRALQVSVNRLAELSSRGYATTERQPASREGRPRGSLAQPQELGGAQLERGRKQWRQFWR